MQLERVRVGLLEQTRFDEAQFESFDGLEPGRVLQRDEAVPVAARVDNALATHIEATRVGAIIHVVVVVLQGHAAAVKEVLGYVAHRDAVGQRFGVLALQ